MKDASVWFLTVCGNPACMICMYIVLGQGKKWIGSTWLVGYMAMQIRSKTYDLVTFVWLILWDQTTHELTYAYFWWSICITKQYFQEAIALLLLLKAHTSCWAARSDADGSNTQTLGSFGKEREIYTLLSLLILHVCKVLAIWRQLNLKNRPCH